MTDHAREAAEKIYHEPPVSSSAERHRMDKVAAAIPIIQSAIDAACKKRDERIAELQDDLRECQSKLGGAERIR